MKDFSLEPTQEMLDGAKAYADYRLKAVLLELEKQKKQHPDPITQWCAFFDGYVAGWKRSIWEGFGRG
jgi:hypothetical protein